MDVSGWIPEPSLQQLQPLSQVLISSMKINDTFYTKTRRLPVADNYEARRRQKWQAAYQEDDFLNRQKGHGIRIRVEGSMKSMRWQAESGDIRYIG